MDLIHVASKGRYRAIPYENLSFANAICFTCGRRVGKVLRALGRMAWRWGLCLEGSGNPCWKVHEWSQPAEGFIPHQGDYPCSQSWNLVVAQFLRLMDSFK